METLGKPPASRAVVEATSDGVRVALPPPGVGRRWPALLLLSAITAVLACLAALAVRSLSAAGGVVLFLCLFWLVLTLAGSLQGLVLVSRVLRAAFTRATVLASRDRLVLRQGVLFSGRERTWDPFAITALDEDEGALAVLHAGLLQRCLDGRDVEELAWLADLLRRRLGVPADPPGLDGEVLVSYHLPGWPRPRRGFVAVTPGRFRLRPRFSTDTGLVLRPGLGPGEGTGSRNVRPEDVRWGIGPGGQAVLRFWLHEGKDQAVALEVAADRPDELRRAMEWFCPGGAGL